MGWNDPFFQEGAGSSVRTGPVILHGFTGSPRSMQEPALMVPQCGYSVALLLLSGRGTTREDVERAWWTDRRNDADNALDWLRQRADLVFAYGLSMRGTLPLWLAERHPELGRSVTINALVRHLLERGPRGTSSEPTRQTNRSSSPGCLSSRRNVRFSSGCLRGQSGRLLWA